jgi:uncharacterized alkaline shock family protein YloU
MDVDGSLGSVSISTGAIAQIVGHIAGECYGVVAMAGHGGRVGRLLLGDAPERGVDVVYAADGLAITLHVVVEHGLNLAEVAATLRSRAAYEVGRLTGIKVSSVEVHISDVRTSA